MPTKHANLVKRLNRESENRAMSEDEAGFNWFFYGVLLLVAMYVVWAPR